MKIKELQNITLGLFTDGRDAMLLTISQYMEKVDLQIRLVHYVGSMKHFQQYLKSSNLKISLIWMNLHYSFNRLCETQSKKKDRKLKEPKYPKSE
jgi:hypothetical protein